MLPRDTTQVRSCCKMIVDRGIGMCSDTGNRVFQSSLIYPQRQVSIVCAVSNSTCISMNPG